MYLVRVLTKHKSTLDIGIMSRYKAVARLHLFTSVVPTRGLRLVTFLPILCVTVNVTTYALVTFHIERVCTLHYVMGPHLTSLTRDNFLGQAAISDTPTEGNAHC
jgi:hypothetical protein